MISSQEKNGRCATTVSYVWIGWVKATCHTTRVYWYGSVFVCFEGGDSRSWVHDSKKGVGNKGHTRKLRIHTQKETDRLQAGVLFQVLNYFLLSIYKTRYKIW